MKGLAIVLSSMHFSQSHKQIVKKEFKFVFQCSNGARQPSGEQMNHAVHMHCAMSQLRIIYFLSGLRKFPNLIMFFHGSLLVPNQNEWDLEMD